MSNPFKCAVLLMCAALAWAPAAAWSGKDKHKDKEDKEDGYEDAVEDGVREAAMDAYEEGKDAIDDEEWQDAVRSFNRVIQMKNYQADGALFWKSYALSKMGNVADALKGLYKQIRPGTY